MLSASFLLVIAALIVTVINAVNGRVPLWVAVLLLCLALLVR